MSIPVIGIGVIVLLYVIAVALLALELRKKPQPYQKVWIARYSKSVKSLQKSLWFVLVILAIHAVLFLIPSIVSSGPTRMGATIFGVTDLLYAVVIWILWWWTSRLMSEVA